MDCPVDKQELVLIPRLASQEGSQLETLRSFSATKFIETVNRVSEDKVEGDMVTVLTFVEEPEFALVIFFQNGCAQKALIARSDIIQMIIKKAEETF